MKATEWLVSRLPAQTWLWSRIGLRLTVAGWGYLAIWLALLGAGLYHQYNLIMLTAALAAGPLAASFAMIFLMLRKISLARRVPSHVFEGEPLVLDYTLRNDRTLTAALAVEVRDELDPQDRSIPGATRVRPKLAFERVPPRDLRHLRWKGPSLVRGRYTLAATDLVTRSPFGLIERRKTVDKEESLIVYPALGRLKSRWRQLLREAKETRRGRRQDRTAQQQEYHGLREYRSGDSLRLIHWRTTARLGRPMVREFEQEHDQQIAVLLDPWLPRTKVTLAQREALEQAIRFVATVCVEACRASGQLLLLGWTGTAPSVRQGPATSRLLHELLEHLALLRGTSEGHLAALLDAMPPSVSRESRVVLVSTRAVHLPEELARSQRLSDTAARGLAARWTVLDVTRGDLDNYIEFNATTPHNEVGNDGRDNSAFQLLLDRLEPAQKP